MSVQEEKAKSGNLGLFAVALDLVASKHTIPARNITK